MVSHSSKFIPSSTSIFTLRVFSLFAAVVALLAITSSSVQADVVSYFNFDSGNYVNSQLTPTVSGAPTTVQSGKYGQSMDFAVGDKWTFTGAQLVDFLSSLNKTCTISFWAKVKSDTTSTGSLHNAFWLSNDATFNSGSSNNRNMFTHFAYNSGKAVYFDSGNSGYDRINKTTTPGTDYPEGEWVHWTYVKDANAGTMRVYRNGVEWMSGGSKSRSIAGIVGMTIANDLSIEMDDFVVDNKALSSGEILNLATSQSALVSDVMNRSLNNASMEISPGGIGEVGTMRFIQQQNIAYGRGAYASQINTYDVGSADRAVDGNTNTTWGGKSMIHTNGGAVGDWWQIQFADTDVPVDKVTIWNRTENGCTDRLGKFTMNFYTENPTTNPDATPVYTYYYSGTFPGNGTIDLPETFNASWVRITNGVNKPLNISEVQIYSPTDNGGFSAASSNGAIIDGKQYQSYNMSLSGNSVLTMDVNGSEMDSLSVSGALTMGGTLKLNIIDASAITAADIPNLLKANSYSGKFDSIVITGDDAAAFDRNNFIIRSVANQNISVEQMVHWLASPEDNNAANVNNWSSDPANQNVAVGLYSNIEPNLSQNTAMQLGYAHLGYNQDAGDSSWTLTNGASLSVTGMSLGENSNAVVTVESGATLTDSGDLLIGYNSGSNGTLNVNGGTVTVANPSYIGNYGTAEVNVSDGKLIFNNQVRIANFGQPSELNVSGTGEVEFQNRLYIGQREHQKGVVTLSENAKMTVDNFLFVGGGASKNNTSGGNLAGSDGSGILTLKGNSTLTVNGNASDGGFFLGACANNSTVYKSILNVSDNATMTVTGQSFYVANGYSTTTSKAQAEINLTGGTINANTVSMLVADSTGSVADINVSGGAFNINADLWLGVRGTATITLSGGEINASKVVYLGEGHSNSSTGKVVQTGGTFNATSTRGLVFGTDGGTANYGTGSYTISGGTLNATTLAYGSKAPKSAQFTLSGTGVANISGLVAVPTTVSGGTLNANGIALPASGALAISGGTVNLGEGGISAAGEYTFTLSGGTISTKDASWTTALNAATSNTITFTPQADQTITWTGALSGSGAITKKGAGTLTLSGNNSYTGNTTINAGTLNITGGTVTTNKLLPGVNAGETGIVNISGGVVTVNAESEIGNNGSGKITVSGNGKLTFNGTARIANMGKAQSYINIQDNGEVTVANLFVGQRGSNLGSMTLTDNAKLRVTNNINIGTYSGSKGSGNMTLKDKASVLISPLTGTNNSRCYLGYNSGTSTLDISGNAAFKVENVLDFLIGESGTGVINQTGGTITLNPTGIVYLADSKTGKANINISGGKFNIDKTLIAGTRGTATINLSANGEINAGGKVVLAPGYETTSNTTVNQTGGTFNADAGIVYGNYFANRGTGVYNLSGGTLNTTSMTYGSQTPASAQFNLSEEGVANISELLAVPTSVSGGTLNVNAISIPSGKALTISGGTVNVGEGGIAASGAYTFALSGGTLATNDASWSSALNATIANNATVTFSPEADQTIMWAGGLSGNGTVRKEGEGKMLINAAQGAVDVQSLIVSSGRLDMKTYLTGNLEVGEILDGGAAIATFSPGNSVGTLIIDGAFKINGGSTLLIEQDATGMDKLVANSFDIAPDSILELTVGSVAPGATYAIIQDADSDIAGVDFWNSILSPESSYYWTLSVDGNTLYASLDANAVPEPSTWALLILGAAGLMYFRKRK